MKAIALVVLCIIGIPILLFMAAILLILSPFIILGEFILPQIHNSILEIVLFFAISFPILILYLRIFSSLINKFKKPADHSIAFSLRTAARIGYLYLSYPLVEVMITKYYIQVKSKFAGISLNLPYYNIIEFRFVRGIFLTPGVEIVHNKKDTSAKLILWCSTKKDANEFINELSIRKGV